MKKTEFYFDDPRLGLSTPSRFVVRLLGYFSYAVIAALALVFALSELRLLNALAILIGLFFLDVIFHVGRAEKPLEASSLSQPNVRAHMQPPTLRILESALDRATLVGGDVILHLMASLVKRREIERALIRMDVKPSDLLLKLEEYIKKTSTYPARRLDRKDVLSQLALEAFLEARSHYGSAVEPHDLFAVLRTAKNPYVDRLLLLFEVNPLDLESALLFSRRSVVTLPGVFHRAFKRRKRIMNRAWTARPTPWLDQFSVDLTDQVRRGLSGFLIGHHKEYEHLVDVLCRPGNPNAILVGEAGSGKETIVAHLAAQIIKDRVPKPLFDKRLVSLDIGSVVAGAEPSEVQERLKRILHEVVVSGNIVLYIPDLHNLMKTGGAHQMSAADILLPALRGAEFSVVGATYPQEYKRQIESNSDSFSAFETIRVQEISEEEAVHFLVYVSLILEKQYKLTISFGAIKKAVSVAKKYFRDKLLPSSAEDLLKETVADAVQQSKGVITADDIITIAERKVNIPLREAKEGEAEKLLNLEEYIHQKFIDQNEAVSAVSAAMREYRAGLSRKGGPIATFLFVGPTGVGKTELSKILAEIQFSSREAMIRFDMSEYQDKQSFFRLIGSPDGTTPGQLTDAVRGKPYSLILLDEFEKAYPDVLNLFLQVFDDGRLTDNLGRIVDFSNTIIIATSNAHSGYIKEEIEKGTSVSTLAQELKKKLTDVFRPELLNRFSQVIVFKSLSLEDIENIVRLNLKELVRAVEASHGISLQFDISAIQAIARLGYDPALGARPLRQVISQRVRSALAEKILQGVITKGAGFSVRFEAEEFHFIPVDV